MTEEANQPWLIVTESTFLVVLSVLILYVLYCIWPHPTPTGATPQEGPATTTSAQRTHTGPHPASTTGGTTKTDTSGAPTTVTTSAATATATATSDTASTTAPTSTAKTDTQVAAQLPDPATEPIFRSTIRLYSEQRLLLIVLLSGALGACIHALRSLAWYVGNRDLKQSWALTYVTLPVVGSLLAYTFYVVVRGGFFAGDASFKSTSPFGFAATATLVGMFSQQAVLKLKAVADTLFSKPEPGADARPQGENPPPTIQSTTPQSLTQNTNALDITVKGTGFNDHTVATVGGAPRSVKLANPSTIVVTLTPGDVANKVPVDVTLTNPVPGGGTVTTQIQVI